MKPVLCDYCGSVMDEIMRRTDVDDEEGTGEYECPDCALDLASKEAHEEE